MLEIEQFSAFTAENGAAESAVAKQPKLSDPLKINSPSMPSFKKGTMRNNVLQLTYSLMTVETVSFVQCT